LLELFFIFFKIGLFTFGGGYVMLSIIENEFVENKKWMTKEEIMDMIAIAESTPGPVAINSATYVGFKNGGVWGSAFATLGCVLPSFVIIFVISLFIEQFMTVTLVAKAFHGIKAAVAVLIISAAIKLSKGVKKDIPSMLFLFAVIALEFAGEFFAFGISSIVLIILGALMGILFYGIIRGRKDGSGQ
jgi:chromate transporter